jgi:hypothetical protein
MNKVIGPLAFDESCGVLEQRETISFPKRLFLNEIISVMVSTP